MTDTLQLTSDLLFFQNNLICSNDYNLVAFYTTTNALHMHRSKHSTGHYCIDCCHVLKQGILAKRCNEVYPTSLFMAHDSRTNVQGSSRTHIKSTRPHSQLGLKVNSDSIWVQLGPNQLGYIVNSDPKSTLFALHALCKCIYGKTSQTTLGHTHVGCELIQVRVYEAVLLSKY